MTGKPSGGFWHTLLADLALILFIVTASSLEQGEGYSQPEADAAAVSPLSPNASQPLAIWRDGPQAPAVGDWLAGMPQDDRASVLIVAEHGADAASRNAAWSRARDIAAQVEARGHTTQISILSGTDGQISTSLNYDGITALR